MEKVVLGLVRDYQFLFEVYLASAIILLIHWGALRGQFPEIKVLTRLLYHSLIKQVNVQVEALIITHLLLLGWGRGKGIKMTGAYGDTTFRSSVLGDFGRG